MPRLLTIIATALALCALTAVSATAGSSSKKGTKVTRGTTTLKVDTATQQALTAAGVTVTPAKPATASDAGIAFPITNGRVATSDAGIDGAIKHVGGVTLTKGATTVTLRNPRLELDTDDKPAPAPPAGDEDENELTAIVGDDRIDVADVDVTGANATKDGRKLSITGLKATLTKEAADALNAAFGTTLTEGAPLGDLAVATRFNGKKASKNAKAKKQNSGRRGAPDSASDRDHGRGNDTADRASGRRDHH